jgi:hypothetical protein
VLQVYSGDCDCDWGAIEGCVLAAGSVVGVVGGLRQVGFEEEVDVYHVAAHVAGSLQYLWADVNEEGDGRPSSKEHDACG